MVRPRGLIVITLLALAAALMVAQRRPAAAQEPSVLDRLLVQFSQTIEPAMQRARGCAEGKDALQQALAWRREVTLLVRADGDDLSEPFVQAFEKIYDFNIRVLTGCYEESYTLCTTLTVPRHGFEMLRTYRELQLLGREDAVDFDKVDKCLTFAIELDSRIESATTIPQATMRYMAHVRATVPGFSILSPEQKLEGPLEFVDASVSHSGVDGSRCSLSIDRTQASVLRVRPGPRKEPISSEINPDFALVIAPGNPRAFALLRCVQASGVTNSELSSDIWRDGFRANHAGEALSSDFAPEYLIRDWTYIGGAVLYEKSYMRFASALQTTYNETTTLRIRHTPR